MHPTAKQCASLLVQPRGADSNCQPASTQRPLYALGSPEAAAEAPASARAANEGRRVEYWGAASKARALGVQTARSPAEKRGLAAPGVRGALAARGRAVGGAGRARAPRQSGDRPASFYYTTWDRLAYESQPFAKKVASALALFALPGIKLGHSARVRTIKHRLERWKPLECPRRAAPTAAKECFGERTNQP